jgi:hypothetical protein
VKNNYFMKAIQRIIITFSAIALVGCSTAPRYAAEEVHQTIAAPGFSSEIHATGIEKTTLDDGSVVRKGRLAHAYHDHPGILPDGKLQGRRTRNNRKGLI